MIYYLDASALVKIYFREKGSEAVVRLLESDASFFSSVVIYPEVLFGLRRRLQNKEITNDYFREQVKLFEEHFQALINLVEFNEQIRRLLKDKTLKYPMKALDAVHLSSALWIKENIVNELSIVCSDKELLKFCKEEGLNVINPEEMDAS